MIIVTGAAGFIGSCLIHRLNSDNFKAIIAVDKFDNESKNHNLDNAIIQERVDRDEFMNWLDKNYENVEFLFHIGARTDTAEFDMDLLHRLNTDYTKEIWKKSVEYQIPLVYASTAATYGLGEEGYDDNEATISKLKPLTLTDYPSKNLTFGHWHKKRSRFSGLALNSLMCMGLTSITKREWPLLSIRPLIKYPLPA